MEFCKAAFKSIGKETVFSKKIKDGSKVKKGRVIATIIAKTKRDEIMKKLSISFPEYLWNQNKGYPTKKHKNAISEFGITKHHRKSFKLT